MEAGEAICAICGEAVSLDRDFGRVSMVMENRRAIMVHKECIEGLASEMGGRYWADREVRERRGEERT